MSEPGLDLHEWATQWEELQEAASDDPQQALPEIVRFVGEMLRERQFELDEPVTEEGQDADIVRSYLAAREIARAAERTDVDPEDVMVALEGLSEIYDYIIQDRAPP
jgi:hypothetical protein